MKQLLSAFLNDWWLLTTVAWVLLGGVCGILVAYAVATWLIVGSGL
jgi:hypothetical protein